MSCVFPSSKCAARGEGGAVVRRRRRDPGGREGGRELAVAEGERRSAIVHSRGCRRAANTVQRLAFKATLEEGSEKRRLGGRGVALRAVC